MQLKTVDEFILVKQMSSNKKYLHYWTKEVRGQTEKLHFSVRGQTLKMQISDNQYSKPSLSDL